MDVENSRSLPLHIPTEICENIIDMLYSLETEDTLKNISTLHSCALVCRAWRVRSQRTLFYLVQLTDTTSFRRLSKILDDSRHLRDYVYQVELTGHYLHSTTSIFATFPAVFAGKLPNLFRIEVVHFPDTEETPFPRTSDSPKARALPYVPLHPRFSAFLSAFTAVSVLYLQDTTFRTFSEFARMINALPNLEELACDSIRWIAPGGSHPGADFMKQPEWAAGKDTLPPFAPKLRKLGLYDVAIYGAKRLIWTRGPHLAQLYLTIPLSSSPEEPADEILRGLGTITEAWLETIDAPPLSGEIRDHQQVKYTLEVDMYEWEAEMRWWLDHLEGCFPNWVKSGRLELTLPSPRGVYDEWADEKQSSLSGAVAPSKLEEVDFGSLSKLSECA
ncbi:hypothetical protein GSI_11295 [Ganoderma sinense ZZ0214-1]|uniref:F-box domain-containing protein n=1 Tax=Ganoderma sinense ZZ0214-1 TaxID=1077348 RepID=A0A2G8RYM5_9APHY|nr:hypothetical protein GSI_11295 [Ganoderma sinense ZZ0214-1]